MEPLYFFIVPLTPNEYLTEGRRRLKKNALQSLINQTYKNWKVLLIGERGADDPINERFIYLNYSGKKEEKLQIATDYIFKNGVQLDYIIRFDDDDLFSKNILQEIADSNADLIVDRQHVFYNPLDGKVARKVCYWFPNTCIIKANIALDFWGEFPTGEYIKFREKPRLIENEHNNFHNYFKYSDNIIFTKRENPVYLRVLNPDSITAHERNFESYLSDFGLWSTQIPEGFETEKLQSYTNYSHQQSFEQALYWRLKNYVALRNYDSVVLKRN